MVELAFTNLSADRMYFFARPPWCFRHQMCEEDRKSESQTHFHIMTEFYGYWISIYKFNVAPGYYNCKLSCKTISYKLKQTKVPLYDMVKQGG